MKLAEKLQNLLKSNNLLKQATSHTSSLTNPCLISDYLEASLYNSKNSFYQLKPRIGRIEGNLAFNKMRGSSDYINELNRVYPNGKYLTASEILKPYFGYSLANYIMRTQEIHYKEKPITIIEIGCGMGGLADSILSFFKNHNQQIYKRIHYISFEITDNLISESLNLLKKNHNYLFVNNQISIIKKSIYDIKDLNFEDPCYILAFDFLDAIAHDYVVFEDSFEKVFDNKIQDFVSQNIRLFEKESKESNQLIMKNFSNFLEVNFYNQKLIQQFNLRFTADLFHDFKQSNNALIKSEIKDENIKTILSYQLFPQELKNLILGNEFIDFERKKLKKSEDRFIRFSKRFYKYLFNNKTMWIPSRAIKFLDAIDNNFPNHHLIVHDFDYLPVNIFVKYKGVNAPIVYSMHESDTNITIYKELINPPGKTNIYFPVDFELIQFIYKMRYNKKSSIRNFRNFMDENSLKDWGMTRFGFNPLRETHKNTKFLLTIN